MAWSRLSGQKIKKIIEKASESADIYLVEFVDKSRAYINKSDIVKKQSQIINFRRHLRTH